MTELDLFMTGFLVGIIYCISGGIFALHIIDISDRRVTHPFPYDIAKENPTHFMLASLFFWPAILTEIKIREKL